MLKLLGSVLVFGGGALVWRMQVTACRRELALLSDLLSALGRMAEEIRMTRTPLPSLLDKLGRGRSAAVNTFFKSVADAARQGLPVSLAWRDAAAALPLSDEEQAALLEAGTCLGGDEASVCRGLALAQAQLSRSLEEKRHRRPEREKRATALSFSAAALLVILLI